MLVNLAMTVSSSTSASYPLLDTFAAFTEACSAMGDERLHEAHLIRLGWVRSTPTPESPMGRVLSSVVNVASPALGKVGATATPPRTYSTNSAGRPLELMLMRGKVDGGFVDGCRLWDFNLSVESAAAKIKALKSETVSRLVEDGPFVLAEWPSQSALGLQGIQVVYIPAGHPVADALKVSGINFKVTYFGADQ